MSEDSLPYCLAPWVHSHVDMSGQRRLCCVAEPLTHQTQDFEQYWNGDELKQIRHTMLNGEAPTHYCQACLDPHQSSEPRERFKDYQEMWPKLKQLTDAEGSLQSRPQFLDYRVSNTCNLSCRMCHAESSSKIEQITTRVFPAEQARLKNKDVENAVWILPEFQNLSQSPEAQRFHWASGEAFLQEQHWAIIRKLKQEKRQSQTILIYNTNLYFSEKKLLSYLENLQDFKQVHLMISLDGVNQTLEFVRDGATWDRLQKNILLVKDYSSNFVISFTITLTLPTLIHIKELAIFLNQHQLPFEVAPCIPVENSLLLSPAVLPSKLLNHFLKRARSELSEINNDSYLAPFLTVLSKITSEIVAKEKLMKLFKDNDLIDKGFARQQLIQYYQQQPELKKWISSLKHPTRFQGEKEYFSHVMQNEINNQYPFYYHLNRQQWVRTLATSKRFHYLGSAPTLLNRLLSPDPKKFHQYDFIRNQSNLGQLKIHRIRLLSPIDQLRLHQWPQLCAVLKAITYPFHFLTAFHFIAEIEVNRDL